MQGELHVITRDRIICSKNITVWRLTYNYKQLNFRAYNPVFNNDYELDF